MGRCNFLSPPLGGGAQARRPILLRGKGKKKRLSAFQRKKYANITPHQIKMVPFRALGSAQNGAPRSFFGPKFCLLLEFERIFGKSQLFYLFPCNFRKKVNKKQVKSAHLREITVFYPISPYSAHFTLIRATSWGTATNLGI